MTPRSTKSVLLVALAALVARSALAETRPDVSSDAALKAFYQDTIKAGQATMLFNNFEVPAAMERDELKLRIKEHRANDNSWFPAMYPDYEVRKANYDAQIGERLVQLASPGKDATRFELDAFLRKTPVGMALPFQPTPLPTPTGSLAFSWLIRSKPLATVAALRVEPLRAVTTSKMLGDMLTLMKTEEAAGSNLTALPIISEVIHDPAYADGAAKAALKIMAKVKASEKNRSQDFGDLYTDIYTSYREAGQTAREAEDKTWNVLAVFATRGQDTASLFPYAPNVEGLRTLIAINAIGSAFNVLDAATSESNRNELYSLPKSVRTFANYGKVYHFWMAAFLARRMNMKYGNTKAAIAAASISEIGYQAFAKTVGRDKLVANIATSSTFSTHANKTRIDLAFGYAGAMYGAHFAQSPDAPVHIDVNDIVRKSLAIAGDSKPLSAEGLKRATFTGWAQSYSKWAQHINPLGILKVARKQIGKR